MFVSINFHLQNIDDISSLSHFLFVYFQEENQATREDATHEGLSQETGLEGNSTEDFGRVADASAVVAGKSAEHVENIVNNRGNNTKVPCSECEQNRKERDEWQEKYKELKKSYYKLAVRHSELDLMHKDLEKVATAKTNEYNIDENAISIATDSDIFTAAELRFLQCMPLEKKKDSTFVLQCVKFAYKEDTSVLNNKSLYGTKGRIEFTEDGGEVRQPAKQPLSPHKVDRMRGVFIDKISKCNLNAVEYGVRMKETYLNQLIASAIKNISK